MSDREIQDWRQRLYESYVSTGQSASKVSKSSRLDVADFPYYKRLLPLLRGNKSSEIADLGCGHGALLYCLRQWGYSNLSGVDVSAEQVKEAHRLGVVEVEAGDLLEWLKKQAVRLDVVFLMDVAEHMMRQELFDLLDAILVSLREGGQLIMHVPNASGLFGMSVRYGDLTHENAFTPRSVAQGLSACGFTEIEVREDKPVVHNVKSSMRRMLWEIGTIFPKLLYAAETGNFPNVLTQNMLVTAIKKTTTTSTPATAELD